jgi:CRP-like cAMP-binding protein
MNPDVAVPPRVRDCYGERMQDTPPTLAGLRGHHLFAGLSPVQLQRLFAASHVDTYEAGHLLFDRGQAAQSFFIVLDGQVNLVLYSKAGEEKIVDILGPGNSFAEAVMFMEGPGYPVSAVAAVHSQVARFSSREYLAILRDSPETCIRMLGHLSQRLHMRIREIEYLTLESATHRLVRLIEGRLPPAAEGPTEVTLQESRQELASRLSMKPETLSRILRHLSDTGAIAVRGRVLQVPDRKRLLAVLDSVP